MGMKALEGVRIADFTRFVSGPFCTQLLADMGAEVIKIEKGAGDDTRHFGPWLGEKSIYFNLVNRNKKSVRINYRTPEGMELVKEIISHCDVIVENFRPGTLDKMGLTREVLDKLNPGIIVTHVSGFGQTGPYKDRAAFDCIAQAMSGIMSLTGDPGTKPMMIGSVYLDYIGGTFGALGTMIALYSRKKAGDGQDVDISMLDAGIAYSLFSTQDYIANGIVMGQAGNRDRALSPANTFKAKDGKYVFIHAGSDTFFDTFARIIKREDLLEEDQYKYSRQRMANPDYIEEVTGQWTACHEAYEIETLLTDAGIPCSVVADTVDVVNNPQVKAREMLRILEYPDGTKMPVTGINLKLSKTPGEIYALPPVLGEHTEAVLRDIVKLDEEKIEELKSKAVI